VPHLFVAAHLFTLVPFHASRSYGSVWRAIKKGTNEEVAIKKVPLDDDVDDLHKEMDVMKECNSPYVVKYHGCYLKGSEELWVCVVVIAMLLHSVVHVLLLISRASPP
jgi:serine/threonine protein kinase